MIRSLSILMALSLPTFNSFASDHPLCPDESYFTVTGDNGVRYGWFEDSTCEFNDLVEPADAVAVTQQSVHPACPAGSVVTAVGGDGLSYGWYQEATCLFSDQSADVPTITESSGTDTVSSTDSGDFSPFIDLFGLAGNDDGIDLTDEGALFTVTSGSEGDGGIFVSTDQVSDQISLKYNFSSTSINAVGGDSLIALELSLLQPQMDGDNGGEEIVLSLNARNRADGIMDVLACAILVDADGARGPFVAETEDGDGDGCAELEWFFGFDTDHTLTIGVDRENQSVVLGFDDDIRDLPSLFPVGDMAVGTANLFVGASGDGSFVQVRLVSLDTGAFVVDQFESLNTPEPDDTNFVQITDIASEGIFGLRLSLDENFIILNNDGTVNGIWNNSPAIGTWYMSDGFWCRTYTDFNPSDFAGMEQCHLWERSGNEITGTRDRGTGTTYSLSIEN